MLAETVKDLRRSRGLTQEAVSLDGGLRRKYVGQLERRELDPSVTAAVGVARGLGMSSAEFFRALAERLDGR